MTTVRDILFTDVIDGSTGKTLSKVEQAVQQLAASGAIPGATGHTASGVAQAMLAEVNALLEIGVSDVLVGAWRTGSALLKAARESLATPDVYRTVNLNECSIPWQYDVDVEVTFNEATAVAATFTAGLEFTINALSALVKNGHLVGFTSGNTEVTARLVAAVSRPAQGTVPLAKSKRTLELDHEFTFEDPGIPLAQVKGSTDYALPAS